MSDRLNEGLAELNKFPWEQDESKILGIREDIANIILGLTVKEAKKMFPLLSVSFPKPGQPISLVYCPTQVNVSLDDIGRINKVKSWG